ncbi:MAG: AAA family ATPase [Promethearchaeota archaeon]
MESQPKKGHTLQEPGYLTEHCPNLLKEFVVEEVFFRCKAQNELPLGSDFVDNLCIGDYIQCPWVFTPRLSHIKGAWTQIIGKEEIKQKLARQVQNPLLMWRLQDHDKWVEPMKTVLLFGPDGCEKNALVQALAEESRARLEIISLKQVDQLASLIEGAIEPTILWVDEADLIAPPIDSKQFFGSTFRMQDPTVSLLSAITKIKKSKNPVVMVMTTDNPEMISSILMKQEYISEIIYVPPPSKKDREDIFKQLLQGRNVSSDVNFELMFERTEGFSVYDLRRVEKRLKLIWAEKQLHEPEPILTLSDFEDVLSEIVPSISSSIVSQFESSAKKVGAYRPELHKELVWDDVGGYASVKEQLQTIISILNAEKIMQRYGVKPPLGVLLFGPPGCGKTYIAKVMASESGAAYSYVNAPDLLSKWLGESEQKVREVFVTAKLSSPSIIFFDEIDGFAFARSRTEDHPYLTTILSTFLSEMGELKPEDRVLVIGATNRPEDIDPAFLRPGRFDERVAIGPPDLEARKEIFRIHTRKFPLSKNVDFDLLAKKTKNYTGAEIEYICQATQRMVATDAVKTGFREIALEDFLQQIENTRPDLSKVDIKSFERMLEKFERRGQPATKFIQEEICFSNIGGLHSQKEILEDQFLFPLKYPTDIVTYGIQPKSGLIVFGPSGCGKSILTKALANEANAAFFSFSATEINSVLALRTDGFKRFEEILRDAERAAPSIIMLEDIETLNQEIAAFLANALERVPKEIPLIIICETTHLGPVSEILLRSGEINYILPVPPPNTSEREEILTIKSKTLPISVTDYSKVAKETSLFSGADLEKMLRTAAYRAFKRKLNNQNPEITLEDIFYAIDQTEPSLNEQDLQEFRRQAQQVQRNKRMGPGKLYG